MDDKNILPPLEREDVQVENDEVIEEAMDVGIKAIHHIFQEAPLSDRPHEMYKSMAAIMNAVAALERARKGKKASGGDEIDEKEAREIASNVLSMSTAALSKRSGR